MQLILGTVQLGKEYGINNKTGKPSYETAKEILSFAHENGIDTLDTASGYGESESVIGKFQKETGISFNICTKLPVDLKRKNEVCDSVSGAIKKLSTERIKLLYLHEFKQIHVSEIIEGIISEKKKGNVELIGVSVYEPKELDEISLGLNDIFDAIQIPYNIFDSGRWNLSIKKAKDLGKKIYGRSVYLQGLAYKNPEDEFVKGLEAGKYIRFVNQLAAEKNTSVANLLMDFNKSSSLDGILVGCETKAQLENNISVFKNPLMLKKEDVDKIEEYMRDISKRAIDPRSW